MSIKLAIVIPCYNEEEVLHETNKRLIELITRMEIGSFILPESAIYYVDDGSNDQTWEIIRSLTSLDSRVRGIKLSHNSGHQNALLAGLMTAEGDAVITVDADLQDDINVIEEMVHYFQKGFEVVYGVRKSRESDTVFKRCSAQVFYRILRWMGAEIVDGHADFRLLGRPAVECLRQYTEVNVFLRGIIPQLGFSTSTVYYDRAERFAGETKYSFSRMLGLAVDGITSFSVMPLRFISVLGLIIFFMSITMVAWVIYGHFIMRSTIPGWASSVIPIYFLGGIQLLCFGVVGEYIGKIYLETKRRPRYFIEKII